jgi:ribose transport system substrate-binding protein
MRGWTYLRAALAPALVTAALLLAGCGSSSSGSSSSSGGSSSSSSASTSGGSSRTTASLAAAQALANEAEATPTKIPQTTPLPHKPPAGKLFVGLDPGIPAAVEIADAQRAAAEAAGWRFKDLIYDAANPASIVADFQQALQLQPAAVGIGAIPTEDFASVLPAYKKAGVPIVEGNEAPFTPTSTIIGNPAGGGPEAAAGRQLADWFIANSHGHGKALFEQVTAFTVYQAFNGGFEAELKKRCSGCSYQSFDVSASDLNSNQTVSLAVSKLRTSPGVKYLFFDNGSYADGIQPALKTAGFSDVAVGGRSIDQQGAAALRAGENGAWTGTNYNWIGYTFVDVALRHIEGVPIPAADSDAVGQLITPQNIKKVTVPYVAPTDALDQFKTLWKVG